jgi:hypothetical protein
MANLEFAYAAPSRVTLPASVTKALPRQEWHVTSCKLDAIEHLTTPPDFMWVDFGKAPKLAFAQSVLTHLAGLQESRPEHPFFFISGSALPEAAHEALVQRIYATFHDPSNVVADLVGQPDLSAAIAKFLAQRKARATRLAPVVKPVAPAVRVPNADLRSERGRLSIKLIAELFGMDVIEVGRAIGRDNKATLSKTPDADALQELLKPFSDIALLRAPGFGDEQFRKWLNTPNEHMRNRAPMDWIRDGRATDVGAFVYNMLTGQPT